MEKIINTAIELTKIESTEYKPEGIKKVHELCKNYFANKPVFIKEYDNNGTISPVLIISNKDTTDFDIITVSHIDVVPGSEEQFNPQIKDGKLYARGSLDMKTQVAITLEVMNYVLDNNLDLSFGLLIGSDEETGGAGAQYMAYKSGIKTKIVLDSDIGGNIEHVAYRCKSSNAIKLIAQGKNAHGSLPWLGIDAIELIMQTVNNLRKHFPYYAENANQPENDWINTMHVGKISGGSAVNVIASDAEAHLDIRLTESMSVDELHKIVKDCLVDGVSFEVIHSGIVVNVDKENKYLQKYIEIANKELGRETKMINMGGATDARHFSDNGATIIMHTIGGNGMHTPIEYCIVEDIETLYNIYTKFLSEYNNI